jgi:hypothetical protein
METQRAVVNQMIEAFGHGPDALAVAMGLTPAGLNNRRFCIKGQHLREDELLTMQQISGTTLYAAYIAARSGGVFVALPDCGDVDNDELLEKQQRLVEELGDMTRLLRESIRNDGAIDADERAGLQDEVRKLYQLAHELVSVAVRVYGRD